MKWIWMMLGLVVVAAGVILWQEAAPRAGATMPPPVPSAIESLPPVPPSRAPDSATDRDATPTALEGSRIVASASGSTIGPATSSDSSAPSTPTSSSSGAAESASAAPSRTLPKIEHATVVAGKLERQSDGSLIADDRFRITGSGTEADPYRVSWECLISAQETYIPRLSETELPERIAMLDGKVVRMEGFVAFPLLGPQSSELILMLNQWDGCCIGVPPTPYDAIEVKLVEPVKATGGHKSFSYGSVTGTFKVEPFLMDNWLVGLYLLEDAHYDADGL